MQEKDYWIKLNKNTLICHSIIVFVLILAYVGEVLKANRTLAFFANFTLICTIPLIFELYLFKKKPDSKSLKTWFVIGYSIFYTYNMFTAGSVMNYVYVLPMASVLLCYCDFGLIFMLFGYAIFINLLTILFQHYGIISYLSMATLAEHITSYEIQIACLVLTGIFLYLSTKLIRDRTNIISDLIDDVYEDALTGCKNVRFYEDMSKEKFDYNTCERLSIAFIDIDDFKHFNTDYGHTFGDAVLKEIRNILIKLTADIHNTFAIRIGGDEFVIISKSLQDDAFQELMNKIKVKIANTIVKYDSKEDGVNISIGISNKHRDKHCKDLYSLYVLADERNQKAKDMGKNCIVFGDINLQR